MKAGIKRTFSPVGATVIWGEWGQYNDMYRGLCGVPSGRLQYNGATFCATSLATGVVNSGYYKGQAINTAAMVTGSEVTRYGVGVVQEINSAAMHLFARWQHLDLDLNAKNLGYDCVEDGDAAATANLRQIRQEPQHQLGRSRHLPDRWRDLLLSQTNHLPIEAAPLGRLLFASSRGRLRECSAAIVVGRPLRPDADMDEGRSRRPASLEREIFGPVGGAEAAPAAVGTAAAAAADNRPSDLRQSLAIDVEHGTDAGGCRVVGFLTARRDRTRCRASCRRAARGCRRAGHPRRLSPRTAQPWHSRDRRQRPRQICSFASSDEEMNCNNAVGLHPQASSPDRHRVDSGLRLSVPVKLSAPARARLKLRQGDHCRGLI